MQMITGIGKPTTEARRHGEKEEAILPLISADKR
jgi:hypothetical protein